MRIIETPGGEPTIALEREELRVLRQALNEVCNGPDAIEAWEFHPRMGVEKREGIALLDQVASAYRTAFED